jgi:hypothetical protein
MMKTSLVENKIRRFTTENRSSPSCVMNTRKENQSLQDLEHLTDFSAEEFDALADIKVGEQYLLWGWFYIERTQ